MIYTWLLDAGHGGITADGKYTTAPAKMKEFADGFTVYEGQINRQITEKLYRLCQGAGISFALLHDDIADTRLEDRTKRANKLHAKHKNCILLSIHSNAGEGRGLEVWTSPGFTDSDIIAEPLCKQYKKHFPLHPFRADKTDGDLDKESKFWMLVKSDCPAVLVENFFFDTREEAELLVSHAGQMAIAQCLFEWILEIETTQPI